MFSPEWRENDEAHKKVIPVIPPACRHKIIGEISGICGIGKTHDKNIPNNNRQHIAFKQLKLTSKFDVIIAMWNRGIGCELK